MITLDDLKAEANVTHDGDDLILQRKLDGAIAWVSAYLGSTVDTAVPEIEEAILRLAAHRYEFGDGLPEGLQDALRPFRNWSF
ncbi:MAG: head-tail connector protein [Mesorhizobium sp.]|nr:head-tail connector protein [Mesorhizobium sp.]MCO5159817.1 head-tail connector protein [Mesorhizobium sp.]